MSAAEEVDAPGTDGVGKHCGGGGGGGRGQQWGVVGRSIFGCMWPL